MKRWLHDISEGFFWWLLVKALRIWSTKFMDQWESIRFDTKYGMIYVTIGHSSEWPNSHDLIDGNGKPLKSPTKP